MPGVYMHKQKKAPITDALIDFSAFNFDNTRYSDPQAVQPATFRGL